MLILILLKLNKMVSWVCLFIHRQKLMLVEDVHVHDDVILNMNNQSPFHDSIVYQL